MKLNHQSQDSHAEAGSDCFWTEELEPETEESEVTLEGSLVRHVQDQTWIFQLMM